MANSGKTTLVNCLRPEKDKEKFEVVPTVGFSVERFTVYKTKLTVVDMSGDLKKYKSLWECYYEDTDAVIFVVDSSVENASELELARKALREATQHERLKNVPLVVFANKSDLPSSRSASEIATAMQLAGEEFAGRAWHIGACCAKKGEGVHEGIRWVLERT